MYIYIYIYIYTHRLRKTRELAKYYDGFASASKY